ncbi:hypothetical protein B0H13DRAFT_2076777 [Mycena leptocephala]|nr:hypothetical protein B0H13DRAFT_2076777 [Mycena leptocephala]
MAPLNVLAFGASRNIGYFSAVRLLEQGATVTFLLRSPSIFNEDALIQTYLKSGNARIVKGDATQEADTCRAWDEAGVVDAVLFSIGPTPQFSVRRGLYMDPPNLVTQCLLNRPQPKIITISSTGLSPLPTPPSRPAQAALQRRPHHPAKDKIGAERTDGEPEAHILARGGHSDRASLRQLAQRVLIIRPALLTDGKCVADELSVSEKELGGYTISRKDTAHFVVDALSRWKEFGNKCVNVAY